LKKVEAIIRPGKLDEIKDALAATEILGITVSQVLGFGKQKGYTQIYRGQEVSTNLLPKIKLEIITTDEKVEEVIGIIIKTARTGQVGDGKIFVQNVHEVVRIRTGEQGEEAI
jgi:nitrogen regulatory protein P-II 1